MNLTNPPESQKGKFGIIYTNVGTYEGKQLDLKITINNWDKYSKKNASISYVLNTIDIYRVVLTGLTKLGNMLTMKLVNQLT